MSKECNTIAAYEIINISHTNKKSKIDLSGANRTYVSLDSVGTSKYLLKVLANECITTQIGIGYVFKRKAHRFNFVLIDPHCSNSQKFYIDSHLRNRWLIVCEDLEKNRNSNKAAKWLIKQARILEEQEANC